MQPIPAAVTACLYLSSVTSPAAKTPTEDVFNIADIAIVSGGISVLIYSAKDSFSNS
jgi:lipoprotein signal peptidase